MKWTIFVVILLITVFLSLPGWLVEPNSVRALDSEPGIPFNSTGSEANSPDATPSPTATLSPNEPEDNIIIFWPVYIPFIRLDPSPTPTPTPTRTPIPNKEFLVCSSPGKGIPDGTIPGLRADITLNEMGVILDLDVYVKASHTYVGDLAFELVQRASDSTTVIQSSVLLDRPGLDNSAPSAQASASLGCSLDHIQTIFDSKAEQFAENKCQFNNKIGIAIGGIFKPQDGLDQFRGQPASGTWSLLVSDGSGGNSGTLDKWCLHGWVGESAAPIPPPTPSNLPASATISGVTGQKQALPLDCETRSAVDWAKFFGVNIDEMTALNKLPDSDNPDEGFVGNVNGAWGQIPPNDYGVHAWPIANVLRSYGLNANANRGLKFDDLRAEIAKGNPVIVWIAGNVERSAPEYFKAPSDQGISIVARYEHTVIVYGYDSGYVYVQNGGMKDAINVERFLDSWSALGNMAIMMQP